MRAEFDLKIVEDGVAGTRFEGLLVHFASAGSTNQLALQAAAAGVRGGVWIADEQTAGRGRGGHSWYSAAGEGLYASALVAPGVPVSEAAKIPLATGLAARAAVLETTGLSADMRWPNDLMFGERKFGGILVESASESSRSKEGREVGLRFAVIGVGINVNQTEFPKGLVGLATSLAIESGRNFGREVLLASLLRHLDDELKWLDGAVGATATERDVASRFARVSSWVMGKRVRVEGSGGYTGTTRGLDRHGFLVVEEDGGTLRTVLSGGVRSA